MVNDPEENTDNVVLDEEDTELEKSLVDANIEAGFGSLEISIDELDEIANDLGVVQNFHSDDFGYDEENQW